MSELPTPTAAQMVLAEFMSTQSSLQPLKTPMPKVSVIIPVYKAERFLHRCIDSLLRQTFKAFEVILVDDGSPDGSGKICDEYAEKYSFIKAFHTENGGVSSARNYGISQAIGEWICVIDSDDFVTEDYLEAFFNTGELKPDFLYVQKGLYLYDARSNKTEYRGITGDIPLDGANSFIQGEFNYILNSPCMKLFNRQQILYNQIAFDSKLCFGEDHIFVLNYLLSKKIAGVKFIDGDGYRYVKNENENSLTSCRPSYDVLLRYSLNSYGKRLMLIQYYNISSKWFIEFVKSETMKYRQEALLSLIEKEGYSKSSWNTYNYLYKCYIHSQKDISHYSTKSIKLSINKIIIALPVWLNYLLFPVFDTIYCKLSKMVHKII